MPIQRCVLLLLATGHLATVTCGASYMLPDSSKGPLTQILRWYGAMSGADSSYGFFAPAVGAHHRAKFVLQNESGSTWEDGLDEATSQEVRLRLNGIVEDPFMSGKADEFPEWRQRLVKSWAATMFSRHPTAVSLSMQVEFYDIPTISEYRNASQPKWQTVYRADFLREPSKGSRADP